MTPLMTIDKAAESDLVPLKVAAKKLAMSVSSLRRFKDRGEISYVNAAGIKFRQSDLNEFIERRAVAVQVHDKPLKIASGKVHPIEYYRSLCA